ncbi:MAG: leucyl aminopeptidase [Bdellovibrionales bacterium]|nr:leucyl aminopeptidase [Bdellovibrionales bacterium]
MQIHLNKGSANENNISTLVVFISQQSGAKLTLPGMDKDLVAFLNEAYLDGTFSGNKDETIWFRNSNVAGAEHILVVGLGEVKTNDYEVIRRGAAVALNTLKSGKIKKAGLDLSSLFKSAKDLSKAAQVTTEGLLMMDYDFDIYKAKKDNGKKDKKVFHGIEAISLLADKKSNFNNLKKGLEAGQIIGDAISFCRRLGDTPGNLMTPSTLADETVKAAKGTKIKVTVWDKARIKKEKMGGLFGVSLGSSQDPRFIIMEYKGAGASKKPIALVGKGLTFDSGGISIKPSQSMDEMKYDMQGGATVIATMLAIAKLKLKVNVMGFVPATENMPGPSANKPGDIFTARNGVTVEILNTDAEGRLILSDALAYASEQKPQLILDAATLTGAMVIALGNTHTGVFSRDDKLIKKIQGAADAADELIWPMPLTDYHVADMKGTHADLQNISNFRGAGSSTAAAFLESFVEKGIPWAHFDIAGTGWNQANRYPYCPKKGASGALIRTWIEFIKSH